jgi:phosphatidylglycerol:prolipoprotein diacylglycerol transferase
MSSYSHFVLPYIDPIIFSIGPLKIRWYSLAYILGIITTLLWLKHVNKKTESIMTEKAIDDWLLWAVLSVIIGGRLGYVLFYNFSYFFYNPLQIFAFWHGGMSFHGGLIGSVIGMYIFCKKNQINFWKLCDNLSVIAPIGLFLGRIANFINMELYGRFTESRFGVIFPGAGNYPRHPSQIYEALLEGVLLFIILIICYKRWRLYKIYGILTSIFLVGYGVARFFVEYFREPDSHIGFIFHYITMGQILSLPIIIAGLIIGFLSVKSRIG